MRLLAEDTIQPLSMHACDEIENLRLTDQVLGQDLGFLTQVLRG